MAYLPTAAHSLSTRLGKARLHLLYSLIVSRCGHAQEYNVGKRIEHSYKSIFNNGNSISAVDPKRYSQRFQEFMQKVFV